jgi:hypothetical protein
MCVCVCVCVPCGYVYVCVCTCTSICVRFLFACVSESGRVWESERKLLVTVAIIVLQV